jgi:excisionase family DNA binding protein
VTTGSIPSTQTSPHGAPVVRILRPVQALLRVRQVAEALGVCRATVYALVERGELERVWVGDSMRIPAASLAKLVAKGSRRP